MNKKILRLAGPNILSNLSIPLLSIVDTALMGHLESPAYLGAIAIAGVIFNNIYWGFGFLRMGTTGLTAQAYGKEQPSESMVVLTQALVVAVLGGLAVLLLQYPIAEIGLWFLEPQGETAALTSEYYYIRIWAAPAAISIYAFSGWFLGMQNAVYPMVITIVVNVVNIVGNLYFIKVWGMKSDGVALATVIAQYVGLFLSIGLFLYKYSSFLSYVNRHLAIQYAYLKRFFTVNRDIFIRTVCLVFAFSFFTDKSAEAGETILAANAILLQYLFMMAYAVDGFAFAAESLVGRYVGAKDRVNIVKSVRLTLMWGMGFGALFSLVYVVFGDMVLFVFTDLEEVMATARQYLFWLYLMPLAGAAAFVWDGIYIGATASIAMRNAMLVSVGLVYLPAYYILTPFWGNHGLWLAMLLFMVVRSVTLWAVAPKHIYT